MEVSKSRLKWLKVQVGPDWQLYELLKQEWQKKNPEATPEEYQQAIRKIADKTGV